MSRPSKLVLFGVALLICGALGLLASRILRVSKNQQVPANVQQPLPKASPSSVVDPLFPERPAIVDSERGVLDPNWVKAPPLSKFQYSRPVSERGGIDPCAAPAPEAAKAVLPLSRGHLFTGGTNPIDAAGKFDLIVHIHGEGPVRRELVESRQPFVLYTLTLPASASYAPLFAGSGLFGHLLDEITAAVSKQYGLTAQVRHVALTAWSAGFEGVRSILYQPEAERVQAVLLIDGLHAPRKEHGLSTNLEPFIRFARRAEGGERLFVITHSSIPTSGYTSTTESAHFLIDALGGRPTAVKRDDGFGLELVTWFRSGNLSVRGYAGNDKADHCAQLFLMRGLFIALQRHFHPD